MGVGAGMYDGLGVALVVFGIICGLIGMAAWWFFSWIFTHLAIAVKWS